jgi:hypothetical protein
LAQPSTSGSACSLPKVERFLEGDFTKINLTYTWKALFFKIGPDPDITC